MRDEAHDIGIVLARRQLVEIFGEGFPVPGNAFLHDDLGDVLDPFHQADQQSVLIGLAGREADPAIAHHDAGDAVARGWRHAVFPSDLPVIVRMDIDEARRNELALGVDLFRTACGDRADCGNAAVFDRNVRLERLSARAVDDRPAANDQIEIAHSSSPPLSPGWAYPIGGFACHQENFAIENYFLYTEIQ